MTLKKLTGYTILTSIPLATLLYGAHLIGFREMVVLFAAAVLVGAILTLAVWLINS